MKINKEKTITIILILIYITFLNSQERLIKPRFLECGNPKFNLQNPLELSISGCYYSTYIFKIFQPFKQLPYQYYRPTLITFLTIIFIINLRIVKKIARKQKVNITTLITLTTLLLLNNNSETIITLLFFNTGLLKYYNNELIKSGLLLSLATIIRPQPGIIMITLLITTLKPLKKHKLLINPKNLQKTIKLLIGLSVIPITYILFSPQYLQVILNSTQNRQLKIGLETKQIIFITMYLITLKNYKKIKNPTFKAYLIATPLILTTTLLKATNSRFLIFLSTLTPLTLLKTKPKKTIIKTIILLLIIPLIINIPYNNQLKQISELTKNQILLLNKTTILTDLKNEKISIYHNSTILCDTAVLDYKIRSMNQTEKLQEQLKLQKTLEEYKKENEIILISPNQILSKLTLLNLTNYHPVYIFTLSEGHKCRYCNKISTLFFKTRKEANDYQIKLIEYWEKNSEKLCKLCPNFYYLNKEILNQQITNETIKEKINIKSCDNQKDITFQLYNIKELLNNYYWIITIITLLVILIKDNYNFN